MKQFMLTVSMVMLYALCASADDKIIGFFLANDSGLTKSKLSEWHDATSFILEKKIKTTPGVVLQTDRELLIKALHYTNYNQVDACIRNEICVRNAANNEMLDGMVIATLIKQSDKFVVEVVFVHKDENEKTIRTKTPYALNAMMDEVSDAIAAIVAEQLQDERGVLEISISQNDALILCNNTQVKPGTIKLKEGGYDIKVSKPGFIDYQEKIVIEAGQEKKLQVTLQAYTIKERDDEKNVMSPRRDTQFTIAHSETSFDLKKTYLISASVSTALSVTALVVGGIYTAQVSVGIDKSNQCANEFCSDFIGPQYEAEKEKTSDNQHIANIMWGVGGATALASITLWVLYAMEKDHEEYSVPNISFVPYQDGGMFLISY